MDSEENSVQICKEVHGKCTYVAIYSVPPEGGCVYAVATTANSAEIERTHVDKDETGQAEEDETGQAEEDETDKAENDRSGDLRVDLITPIDSVTNAADACGCMSVISTENEEPSPPRVYVRHLDALKVILRPMVTCAKHAPLLWETTATLTPTGKHPSFASTFPALAALADQQRTASSSSTAPSPELSSPRFDSPARTFRSNLCFPTSCMASTNVPSSPMDEDQDTSTRVVTVYGKESIFPLLKTKWKENDINDNDILNDPLVTQCESEQDILQDAEKILAADMQDLPKVPGEVSITIKPEDKALKEKGDVEQNENNDSDEEQECWICKETEGTLIHPCVCKGSMQGVHLHCVEDWVAHCKQAKGDKPCCPVCKTPYVGKEVIPGFASYTTHVCKEVIGLILRCVVLIFALIGYWASLKESMMSNNGKACIWFFGACYLSLKVFLVSYAILPSRQRRPLPYFGDTVTFRYIYSEGTKSLMELAGILVILAFWRVFGEIGWWHLIPILLFSLVPPFCAILYLEYQNRTIARLCLSHNLLRCILRVITCPCMTLVNSFQEFSSRPRHHATPFNHLFHTVVCFSLLVFCALPSDELILVTIVVHSVIIAIIFGLHACTKTWTLKRGRLWWVEIQLSALSAYSVNVLRTFEGRGRETKWFPNDNWFPYSMLVFSILWYFMNVALAVTANWQGIQKQYYRWQRRNGSFTFRERTESNLGEV